MFDGPGKRHTHMKRQLSISLCLALLTLTTVSANAQDDWGKYEPRTLNQIIEEHSKAAVDEKAQIHLLFSAELFPSRVKVTYTGEVRKISATRKQFIADWAKTRQLSKDLVALFDEELLFKEGKVEYWLPVQQQVIPYFQKELKVGDSVELYLIWIGARRELGVTDWIFLVNEFEKT